MREFRMVLACLLTMLLAASAGASGLDDAVAQFNAGQYRQARLALQRLIAAKGLSAEENAQASYYEAIALYEEGHFPGAGALFEALKTSSTLLSASQRERADLIRAQNFAAMDVPKFDESRQAMQQFLVDHPGSAEAHRARYGAALALFGAGRVKVQAAADLRKGGSAAAADQMTSEAATQLAAMAQESSALLADQSSSLTSAERVDLDARALEGGVLSGKGDELAAEAEGWSAERRQSLLLARAFASYDQKDWPAARTQLQAWIGENPTAGAIPEAKFLAAMALVNRAQALVVPATAVKEPAGLAQAVAQRQSGDPLEEQFRVEALGLLNDGTIRYEDRQRLKNMIVPPLEKLHDAARTLRSESEATTVTAVDGLATILQSALPAMREQFQREARRMLDSNAALIDSEDRNHLVRRLILSFEDSGNWESMKSASAEYSARGADGSFEWGDGLVWEAVALCKASPPDLNAADAILTRVMAKTSLTGGTNPGETMTAAAFWAIQIAVDQGRGDAARQRLAWTAANTPPSAMKDEILKRYASLSTDQAAAGQGAAQQASAPQSN